MWIENVVWNGEGFPATYRPGRWQVGTSALAVLCLGCCVVCAVRGLCLPPRGRMAWPHPLTTHASGQSRQVRCPGQGVCHTYSSVVDLLVDLLFAADDCRDEPKKDPAAVTHSPRGRRPCHRGVPADAPANLRAQWCSVESVSAAWWAHLVLPLVEMIGRAKLRPGPTAGLRLPARFVREACPVSVHGVQHFRSPRPISDALACPDYQCVTGDGRGIAFVQSNSRASLWEGFLRNQHRLLARAAPSEATHPSEIPWDFFLQRPAPTRPK